MQIQTPDIFKPSPNFPTYPPYHQGLYLEDYFIKYWKDLEIECEREFIAVSWTSYYNNGCDRNMLQSYLNGLDKSKKYFVVCQHDDAPSEMLPPDTLIFSAGGNVTGKNVIPIPLVCSPIPNNVSYTKDIFCSFVGSTTHPSREINYSSYAIRQKLYQKYKDVFYFNQDTWQSQVSSNKLNNFIEMTSRSKFALAPRGYGPTSFRLYEIMQLNCVPVYVSDRHYLPWSDELDWNEFCVLINSNQILNLENILESIDNDTYNRMITKLNHVYEKYFTLESICQLIIRRL